MFHKKINRIAGTNDPVLPVIPRRQVWHLKCRDQSIAERLRIAHLRARGYSGLANIPSRRESALFRITKKINLIAGANDLVPLSIVGR
ncbi:hypothetical protein WMO13_09485 [Ignatzschineria larvae DSM 13226]|uniref:Transposase DDE domain-containing protein n=1 Tax=Ignatzschineria larvae DSM 13226 TaxID=1111732 RepID=A0ABZ3C0P5_9GAMM|nr:hypothetical protein [Ignatzschineria larvae]